MNADPSSLTITPFRLLIDPPAPGPWNMAVDEALLERAAAGGGCCWRFYGWAPPTLSLGYFQPYHDRERHPASLSCPAVRRASGGGAIVHDAEITYALVLPAEHPLAVRRQTLYELVHAALVDVLRSGGIAAELCREGTPSRGASQPFLCFQRRTPGDVLVGTAKIAGSAQRRKLGAVLQHGSLLVRRSPAAPELAGLSEFSPSPTDEERLMRGWLDRLSQRLHVSWQTEPLTAEERGLAGRFAETKYASAWWNLGRNR